MAVLSGKRKAAAPETGRFRVCVATYVSRHKTAAEASAAMKKVKLKDDDITFVIEEPENAKSNSKGGMGRRAR